MPKTYTKKNVQVVVFISSFGLVTIVTFILGKFSYLVMKRSFFLRVFHPVVPVINPFMLSGLFYHNFGPMHFGGFSGSIGCASDW